MRPRPPQRAARLRQVPAACLLAAAATAQAGTAPAAGTREPGTIPAAATAAPEPAIRYDRDVRPILADRCFRCHGPDPAARRAELRLDRAADATAARDGAAAVVPGDPDRSLVWQRLTTGDADDAMPPAASGKPRLDARELALVRRWIEQGAVYEPHWSFVPPQRPRRPVLADPGWARTPVDEFVLAALERHGLAPSPEAAPARLVRRLFLTLTGLPPTPDETAAFVADGSAEAYDELVERLLRDEPYRSRYAEHMAAAWLDAARYADTSGIHTDAGRQAWVWRDWVLRAFRDNMPFDRFVVEQLAGDLLPGATLEQKVASGFHRNHVTTDEGGAIDAEYLVEYAADRTDTTGAVFLGLTLGCARCHDHKYDPIRQEEYYGLFAYFNSIDEPGLYSQDRSDSNRAFEPFVQVPGAEQERERERLTAELDAVRAAMADPPAEELELERRFEAEAAARAGVVWAGTTVTAARSSGGATMTVHDDGSVKAGGDNPAKDRHTIELHTEATDLRLLCLQALPDPDHREGRVGRAGNGNAVLTSVQVEARSSRDPQQRRAVELVWAWADVEQRNGDFRVINVLAPGRAGWAVDAHTQEAAPRTALLLAAEPFGFEGGTDVTVELRYESVHEQHVFGRVRLDLGTIEAAGLELLPEAHGAWFAAGPFATDPEDDGWDAVHGPEQATALDLAARFGSGDAAQAWRHEPEFADGKINELPAGRNVSYVARRVLAPTARRRSVSLGSDDGFRLFLGGAEVAQRRIDRTVAADQDLAELLLCGGEQLLLMKIVNTGGQAAFYLRGQPREGELQDVLVAALLPGRAREPLAARVREAWRLHHSPRHRELRAREAHLERALEELEASIPRAMVMKELDEPRPAHVLVRGNYDQPGQPVERGVPAALGSLPAGAPTDRRGLAQWLVADDNPLVARVHVNRLWSHVFGSGLVRTAEDFGMQGEWPSHPELLDWLAVEFRASGWDVQHVLRLLVRSATFRQEGRVREDAQQIDPDNRLLSHYPRRRLSAEQLRDHALHAAGILVERLGGPSVKPYQPAGLWREVSMTQSNTRTFRRDEGEALFRRSIYTYYKRACPPPAMLAFDAPTREFCTVRRLTTNTPLQALALWNDEQLVEAARALAGRALAAAGDDEERVRELFLSCTGSAPAADGLQRVLATLAAFRDRYARAGDDAAALLAVGTRPIDPDVPPAELAAWTMLASAVMNLDATLCIP